MAGIVKVMLTLLLLSGMVCPIYQCLMMGNATSSTEAVELHNEQSGHSGTIYFNNPHLLNDKRIFLKDGSKSAVPSSKQLNSEIDSIEGVYIIEESNAIASHLRKVVNDELGITSMQAIFDSHLFVPVIPNIKVQVEEMVMQLETKITSYMSILEQNSKQVEELYQHQFWMSPVLPCCSLEDHLLKYNEHFGAKVSFDFSCDIIPQHLDVLSFSPGQNLTSLFEQNYKINPTMKWQYFISTENLRTEYPAHSFDGHSTCKLGDDTRHQSLYLSTIQKVSKYVVIILDHGYSLSNKQLVLGKSVGKQLLSFLSHRDKVSLMSLSSELQFPQNDNCLKCKMVSATYEAKIVFSRFIDGLIKSKEPTNHTLGIVKAFHTIRSVLENIDDTSYIVPMIMYISRGLLNSLMEAKTVLSAIAKENEKLKFHVILNTFAVIDDQKPIMYEKGFLLDIAEQNFKKYNISVPDARIKKGMMISVNSTKFMGTMIRNIFEVLNSPPQKEIVFSTPYWDSVGKGLVISMTRSCFGHGHLIGIVGIDIHLADLVEDITYFNTANKMYAFIIDLEGNTIMHPSYVRPSFASDQPMNTDIFFLESHSNFEQIRDNILKLPSGKETVMSRRNDALNSSSSPWHIRHIYVWKRVPNMPYIICIVDQKENDHIQILKPSLVPTNAEVLYHRLDLAPAPKMCQHLKQLATKDVSTLYLSPSSFQSPFQYLSQEETKRNVQSYMAYLSDGTKLIANPGLKMQIRNDVSILVRITSEWKERFSESNLSKYIVRRYIATSAGAFLMHPGAVQDRMYDPTRRNWFLRALEYPGRVVITAPYLDVGGAGYIVTVSHTIYEGKPAALHSQSDAVVAVMGVDFTLSYFYKLLLDFIPSCNYERIICFLLDDKGYLIAHPGLIEPNGKGPVEQQHITHKEPLVANDILNHKGFVKKIVCNSYSDRSIQRFYQFNVSLEHVISNLVHGEHCSKYQIALIPGTNVFLGIVNQTCDMVTAFCPCSMVDRLCLNCHRMEQSDCECPCECPLEMDLCTGRPLKDEDNHPSCPNYPEEIRMADIDPSLLDVLKPCFESKCSSRKLKEDCFGVIDCEWCQLDSDGITPFKQPFCTQQRKCFGGILGSRTPYADEIIEGLPLEEYMTLKNTPVGPVAGGIMGCFLVLALAVYCYRHRIQRSSQQYISTPGSNIQMSHLNNEVEEMDIQEYLPVGHSNVLVTFENPVSVSPYQMNTNYRRPPGGDSDHGYSTMTPHEDSEYTSSYVEPLAVGKERYRSPGSQSVANSSRASSPVPQPPSNSPVQFILDLSQTTLPETRHSHHILAPVQVHMVDTQ